MMMWSMLALDPGIRRSCWDPERLPGRLVQPPLPRGRLDGQLGQRVIVIHPTQSMRILRSDHRHAMRPGISQIDQRRDEGVLPGVLLVARSHAM